MTTEKLSELTGATLRMLQVWSEKGLLRPTYIFAPGLGGHGHVRDFPPIECRKADALFDLRSRGCPLSQAKRVLPMIAKNPNAQWFVVKPKGSIRPVEAFCDREAAVELAAVSAGPCWVVRIQKVFLADEPSV